MEKVLVINNPNAGRKQAIKYKKHVLKFLLTRNIKFQSVTLDELETINFSEFDAVIVIGGDGTINKLVPYIINTDKILGIIPSGTANLLAAKLGIPSNIYKALGVIEQQNVKSIDVLKINERYSILRSGFGYDSDIICKTPQSLKAKLGYLAYFLSGILFALKLKQKHYTIIYNDKKLSILASSIIIANAGNMFRNFFSISKNCKLDDGLLDVFILKVKNPIMFFIEFLQIIFNRKSSNSKAMYFQTSSILIKNDFCTGHIDGEKRKFKSDIEINLIPRAIMIYNNK